MTVATGGTETNIGGYQIHTFTESGELLVDTAGDVEILIVAGGGGSNNGGGGAGGVIYTAALAIGVGVVTVTVGQGGDGGNDTTEAVNGENSVVTDGNIVFSTQTAIGGGHGANFGVGSNNQNGGSGGGGDYNWGGGTGTVGQGNNGGSSGFQMGGGGGGGAGGVGGDGAGSGVGGNGGVGLAYSISGVSTYYAGGGAGQSSGTATGGLGGGGDEDTAGTANTGGGAGGGSTGRIGGSGIVIIRYAYSPFSAGRRVAQNEDLGDMAESTIKGRAAGAGTGIPQNLTATQVGTILADVFVNVSGDTMTGPLVIGSVDATLATADGYLMQGASGASVAHFLESFGTGVAAFQTFVRGQGTNTAPTAVALDDVIGRIRGRAYDGAASLGNTAMELRLLADEAHTATAHGTRLEIYYTPNGSTTLTKGLTLDSDGILYNGAGTAYSTGLGNASAQYKYLVSGATPFAYSESAGALNIASGKTLTVSETLTLTAAGASASLTLPNLAITLSGGVAAGNYVLPSTAGGGTFALLNTAQTFTAAQSWTVASQHTMRRTYDSTKPILKILNLASGGDTDEGTTLLVNSSNMNFNSIFTGTGVYTAFIVRNTGTGAPTIEMVRAGAGHQWDVQVAADTTLGAAGRFCISRDVVTPFGTELFTIKFSDGFIGINKPAPLAQLHVNASTTTTNAIKEVQRIEATVSTAATGGAAGFGVGLGLWAETATDGTSKQQGRLWSKYIVATNGSETSATGLDAYTNSTAQEFISGQGDAGGVKLGFFGHARSAQPAAYTPTNVTPDRAYDANSTSLDEVADVLGTLIADLQTLGLVA